MSLARALLALLIVSLPAQAAVTDVRDEREKLLVMDLKGSEAVSDDIAQTLTEVLVTAISERADFEALSSADLVSLVELEVQKEAAGCDETSCLAEIGAALGARYVVYGRVSRLDDEFLLHLNLFNSADAKAEGRALLQASSAGALARQLPGALPRLFGVDDPDPDPGETDKDLRSRIAEKAQSPTVIVGVVAGALGLAGLSLGAIGMPINWRTLANEDKSVEDRESARSWFWASAALAAVGAAGAAWGITSVVGELTE